jgi:hypothetical protein
MKNKTNFEILENIYNNFKPEQKGFLNDKEIERLTKELELNRRSELDCRNLQQFAILFYEHKVLPIGIKLDKITNNGRSIADKDMKEYCELRNKKEQIDDINSGLADLIELFVVNHF